MDDKNLLTTEILKMKKMIPLIIAVISAILALLAAWWQYLEKETERMEKVIEADKAIQNERKADNFQKELLKKTENLDSANYEIKVLQAKLLEKTGNLLEESKEVKKVQEETIKFLTGDGYPLLQFFPTEKGTISPLFMNRTKYPIYDMKIRIDDFDEVKKCKSIISETHAMFDRECILKISKQAGPLFLTQGGNSPINYHILPGKRRHFLIECMTKKDIYNYFCVIEFQDSEIKYCIRIYRYHDKRQEFVFEINEGLAIKDEDYWRNSFYIDKQHSFGPMPKF